VSPEPAEGRKGASCRNLSDAPEGAESNDLLSTNRHFRQDGLTAVVIPGGETPSSYTFLSVT
jgi:hypothetical protein